MNNSPISREFFVFVKSNNVVLEENGKDMKCCVLEIYDWIQAFRLDANDIIHKGRCFRRELNAKLHLLVLYGNLNLPVSAIFRNATIVRFSLGCRLFIVILLFASCFQEKGIISVISTFFHDSKEVQEHLGPEFTALFHELNLNTGVKLAWNKWLIGGIRL